MRRESLRLVELVALTPRCLPVVWSFLIHLPGALRSTGITRLHRSYGSSDSCQAAVWRLAGLIASWTEPSDRSVSKHPPSSRSLGLHSTNGRAAESGFLEADPPTEQGNAGVLWLRHWTVGSPRRKTESSSSPTDRSFTSWCSPPPLTRTQFRSVTTARPAADRDSHPADSIHSQSHHPTPHGVGLVLQPYKPKAVRPRANHAGHGVCWWFTPRLTALGLYQQPRTAHGESVERRPASSPSPIASRSSASRKASVAEKILASAALWIFILVPPTPRAP